MVLILILSADCLAGATETCSVADAGPGCGPTLQCEAEQQTHAIMHAFISTYAICNFVLSRNMGLSAAQPHHYYSHMKPATFSIAVIILSRSCVRVRFSCSSSWLKHDCARGRWCGPCGEGVMSMQV